MKTSIIIDQKMISALKDALNRQELHRIKQGLNCNEVLVILDTECVNGGDHNLVSYPSLMRAAEAYVPR